MYKSSLLYSSILACGLVLCPHSSSAQTTDNISNKINAPKSSTQRIAANQQRRNHDFTDFGQDYTDFKNKLNKEYNFDYSVDISYMPQVGAPNGKNTSDQTIAYTSASWQAFQNEYGTGTFNFSYNAVRYGGISAEKLGNRIGAVTAVNDFNTPSNSFFEMLYTHQMPGSWNWLSVSVGQFPLFNFDGSQYDSNQQENFINYALSQNATSTYPTASFGTYVQVAPNEDWTFVVGAQDATNISGNSIHTQLGEEKYTTFASAAYTPTIKNLGSSQYSILLYNQPGVEQQTQTTNGWSLNLSQNLGEKWGVFGRINGVSGDVADAEMSYVLGAVYNNPLDRNPLDQIGVAATLNKINRTALGDNQARPDETILEAYWAWGVSKWMTITPDIQFYINPAQNTKSDNATVLSLRTTVFF